MKPYIRLIGSLIHSILLIVCIPALVEAGIQINSHAQTAVGGSLSETVVDFIIFDPMGHRVGFDSAAEKEYHEFDAGYGSTGIDDVYSVEAYFIPVDGTYTIEVIGDGLMAFSLSASIYRDIADEGLHSLDIEGVTDKGLSSKFQIIYNSDPAKKPGDLKRVATPSILKQDITLSRKIGWIENEGITNSLIKKVEAIEASIAKGNNDTAKNQLNALVNEINAQKGKQIDEKAVKMFLEDAQYIIGQLK